MPDNLDINLREIKQPEQKDNRCIYQLVVTPNGEFAITACGNSTLNIWHVATGQLIHTLTPEPAQFEVMGVTPDGENAAVVNFGDKTLKIWNIASSRKLETMNNGYRLHIENGPIIGRAQWLVPASNDYTLKQWQLNDGKKVMSLISDYACWYTVVETNFDNTKSIYTLSEYQLINNRRGIYETWDEGDDKGIPQYTALANGRYKQNGQRKFGYDAFSNTSGHLYLFNFKDNGEQHVWDLANGVDICNIPNLESQERRGVESIGISPDCPYIIEGFDNGTIDLIDKTSGAALYSFAAHTNSVTAVAITPNQRSYVSVSEDTSLKVWDIESRKLLAEYFGKSEFVSCAVARDGTIIALEKSGEIHFLKIEHN